MVSRANKDYTRYSSWGRTRGPKNLSGTQGGEVDVVGVGTLNAATDGYSTENQRYLHLLLVDKTHGGGGHTVTVYGYNHAFGLWAPLNQIGTSTAVTATVADAGQEVQDATDREMVTFEIAGVDRVAFVGTTADVRVYAAGSTF